MLKTNVTNLNKYFVILLLCASLCSCVWDNNSNELDYLPLDDSSYPYAGLPRLVLETDNFVQIRNTETDVSAEMQFYGQNGPTSEIFNLTFKGRGHSSFTGMPKPSYTIKLQKKQEILGMPKEKEWALIANSADRSLLRNFITYKLYRQVSNRYSPRAEFVELFLNREYQGVYLLTETIKTGRDRVNIPDYDDYYLVEKTKYYKDSDVVVKTQNGHVFIIKSDNKTSPEARTQLKKHLDSLENLLENDLTSIKKYIDIEKFIAYYWIQEFSKNYDGNFYKSIYFTIENSHVLKFGPVWDFDLAYGNSASESVNTNSGWYVRDSPWNQELLSKKEIYEKSIAFWEQNRPYFEALQDTLTKYSSLLQKASDNEFSRWPVLKNTENWMYRKEYSEYNEAVLDLKEWIKSRIQWIDHELGFDGKTSN